MGVSNHSGGQLGPPEAILTPFKNRFSIFFFEIFPIFQDFWSDGVGLLIFDSGTADPHRVPGRCPTLHFLESWASGEHI